VRHQAALRTRRRSCSIRTRDSATQSRTTPLAESGEPNATRSSARAHEPDRLLGHPDGAHAVVDAARAEAGLGDGEPLPLLTDEVVRRHPDVVEDELGVATVVMVVVAEDLHPAHDLDPRGAARGR
jgi:hypothetical protein